MLSGAVSLSAQAPDGDVVLAIGGHAKPRRSAISPLPGRHVGAPRRNDEPAARDRGHMSVARHISASFAVSPLEQRAPAAAGVLGPV
jgi:hypothetical protein